MYPGAEPQRTSPLLLVILAVVIGNLALTAALWFDRGAAPDMSSLPGTALPEYLDATALQELADDLSALYNTQDFVHFYARFDDLARIEFTETDLRKQLADFSKLLGAIEATVYSHHEALNHGQFPAYNLFYKTRMSGGAFSKGNLRIAVIDRGDRYGLFGFFINGSSQ